MSIDPETLEGAKGILKELITEFAKKVANYVGPIYGGFIASPEGPKLLEINARLGDPEAINVLSLMETSIMDVAIAMLNNQDISLEFRDRISILRYLVPRGYGTRPIPSIIDLDEEKILLRGLKIYYASVNLSGKQLSQTTSRSVALVSEGTDLSHINARFEGLPSVIRGEYSMRNDIGTETMIEKKKKAMKTIMTGRA
ncbi:MAG: hypothetical protein M1163_03290 [Candidatus Thermoplasmatota archaeon]|nr:hypothetical protein [Candidatus Thermoplasmatota archaeon]